MAVTASEVFTVVKIDMGHIKLTKQSQRTHNTASQIFHLTVCRLYMIHAQLQKVMTFNDTQALAINCECGLIGSAARN